MRWARGVPVCARCETERNRREREGPIAAADEKRVVDLLHADVGRPIPGDYGEDIVVEAAARQRLQANRRGEHVPGAVDRYLGVVVDEVQQAMHDYFIDTTWPACPLHPNHPLEFRDGWWQCDATRTPIARLGELSRQR